MTSSQNCSTNNQIIISESSIRTLDGLYSLNDLHKAAGGESKHQPAFFMRNEQTLALIEELNSANLQSLENTSDAMSCRTITGRNGGTYDGNFALESQHDTRPEKTCAANSAQT